MTKIKFVILLFPVFIFSSLILHDFKLNAKETKGTGEVNKLHSIAEQYLSINVDSAMYYAKKSFDRANEFNIDTLSAKSAYLIGRAYIQLEKYEKAKDFSIYSMKIYNENKDTKKYMLSLIDLGIICYNLSSFNEALLYYKKLLTISKGLEDKEWFAIALDGIGTTYSLKGDYDIAIKYLQSSLTEYIRLNKVEKKARLLYGISTIYMATTNYDQALDYLLESIKISEEKNQLVYLAMSNHAIGVIYEKLKNYSMALKYYESALAIAESINDKYLIGSFLNDSGELYLHISQIDTALTIANRALSIQVEIANKVGIAHAYDLMGNAYLNNNLYNKSLEYFIKAKRVLTNVDQKYRHTRITNHLGIVYTRIGRYGIAQKYLHKSLDDARKIGAQDLVMESLTALSEFYASTNDYKKAFEYLNEFTHLNDSIFTSSSHHIAEMQMRYETGKREKENELLKNKIDIQNLEIEKSYLQNWLSYLSLAIVSIIGFFSYHRYKAKKKANILLEQKIQDAIKKHQKQQEIIFHQANLSSLGELAAGMAHEINQPLQAIKLSAESLDLELRNTNVEHALITENISEIYQSIDRAKSIIDHVRIFASQQKNQVKEHFNPTSVIDNALSLIGKQYIKKEIFFNLKLNKRIGKIRGNPYKYEQIIFNLLSNAKDALLEKEKKLNQSYRKEIDIRLYREENDLVLLIKDNGIGMGKDQQDNIFSPFYTTKNLGEGTGLGLSIVFGLVKEMNGHILVTSDYDSGTTVKVCIPKAIARIYKVNSNSQT